MQQIRITTNIKKIIANKMERNKATFIYHPTKSYYLYNGERIPPNAFYLMLPIEPKKIITNLA